MKKTIILWRGEGNSRMLFRILSSQTDESEEDIKFRGKVRKEPGNEVSSPVSRDWAFFYRDCMPKLEEV